MSTLCRAFVSLPDPMCDRERPMQERVVFFEVPATTFLRGQMWTRLATILTAAWDVPAADLERLAYNQSSEWELVNEQSYGGPATGDLRLLETGSGGEITRGIVPPGAADPNCAIHYARAADIDLFVTPRTAARLQKAIAQVEALYAAKGGAA